MARLLVTIGVALVFVATGSGSTQEPQLFLPYDLEVRGGAAYVADAVRHQILRYDLTSKRVTVVAGTGDAGSAGDGGPATRARLTEPTELVFDAAGNLYFSDVNQGRVRRVDPRGTITTVARVRAAAGLSVDPTDRYLAIASIEGYVYRVRLPSGPLERIAGDGSDASSGDGGPARDAQVFGPHDVTYDAAGNLLIGQTGGIRRIDAKSGVIDTILTRPGFKMVAAPGGTLYLLAGDPSGGTITQLDARGKVLRVIDGGKLGRRGVRIGAGEAGFLPTDVEPVPGAILITQAQPTPALRRLPNGSSALVTLLR